jgi:ketol-acid reductoisomerase
MPKRCRSSLPEGKNFLGDWLRRARPRDIRSGKFAREFIREMETGARRRANLLRKAEAHPIEKVGARLRSLVRWK